MREGPSLVGSQFSEKVREIGQKAMTLERVLLAGLLAGGMIGTAAADDYQRPNGFYLQGGGGANFLDDDNIPNILVRSDIRSIEFHKYSLFMIEKFE